MTPVQKVRGSESSVYVDDTPKWPKPQVSPAITASFEEKAINVS